MLFFFLLLYAISVFVAEKTKKTEIIDIGSAQGYYEKKTLVVLNG
jgi:aspartokinase-like uncharacterized kinase